MDLIQYETQRFGLSLLGRGLPAFIVDQSIIYLYSNRPNMIWARLGPRHVAWSVNTSNMLSTSRSSYSNLTTYLVSRLETAFGFLLSYNRVYMTMQRLGLFPAWQFFPTIEFYIPFTSVSPIAPVSPPESLTLWAISNWAGRIGLAILPMAVYIFHEQFTEVLNAVLQKAIYDILPRPIEYPASNKSEHHRPTSHDPDFAVVHDSRHPTRLSTGNGGPRQQEDHEIYEDTTANDEEEVPHPNQENYPPEEPLHDIVRQQSRLSARTADEYITDEEDAGDVVGTTLISFDVENETDTPPATWSAAELRAHHSSLASESADKHTRRYRITPLTLMPARLVSYIYANISSRMIAVPFEILWMRLMARSYRTRFGLPTVDMYNIGLLSDFTFRMNVQWNLIEELNLFSSTAIACALIAIAYFKNVSEETWLKNHEDKNSEIE